VNLPGGTLWIAGITNRPSVVMAGSGRTALMGVAPELLGLEQAQPVAAETSLPAVEWRAGQPINCSRRLRRACQQPENCSKYSAEARAQGSDSPAFQQPFAR